MSSKTKSKLHGEEDELITSWTIYLRCTPEKLAQYKGDRDLLGFVISEVNEALDDMLSKPELLDGCSITLHEN